MSRHFVILISLLLLGAVLRGQGLAHMDADLHHDEAYNALDALALVQSPKLTPFFPANTGREGLYYYALAGGLAAFGESVFALRVVSFLLGMLTLAAAYRLARDVLNDEAALWTVGALAVLYWPVHLNHLIFRVNTLPLLGALAFWMLLRARRRNQGWLLAGLLTGLTLYTYVAARVYVGYALICVLWWLLRDAQLRRGAAKALLMALLTCLPLGLALLQPAETTASLERAAAENIAEVIDNAQKWAQAWLSAGDPNDDHNLPARPILDTPLALLSATGIAGLWFMVRRKGLLLWWLGLVLVAFAPTLLSIDAPHYLRGSGLILPLVLLMGAGGAALARVRHGWLISLLLMGAAGINTYNDFSRWLAEGELGIYIDMRVNEALAQLPAPDDAAAPLVIPGFVFHPVIAYRAQQNGYTPIFYAWPERAGACFLTPNREALYLDLPIELSNFQRRAAPYLQLETLVAHPADDYRLFRAVPSDDVASVWEDAAQIGDLLRVRPVAPTASDIARGDTLTLQLAMRLLNAPQREWRFFVHLQGDPTPYDGGQLWATGDAPLCDLAASAPIAGTTLVQELTVPIPADLPAGAYHVALGLYEPTTHERLPLQTPSGETRYYAALAFTLE